MGIRESALNTITALTNSDFVRMVTAAGASRKASLQSVAQHIIENYAGSSLAGSNQSVKAAIDGLNSTLRCDSFADSCTWNSNLDITQAWKTGRVVQLIVRAKSSTTHAEGEVICEIPEGYRPAYTMYTTAYMQGGIQAVVQVSAAGKCVLYLAPSYPTGRFYANIVYMLAS